MLTEQFVEFGVLPGIKKLLLTLLAGRDKKYTILLISIKCLKAIEFLQFCLLFVKADM